MLNSADAFLGASHTQMDYYRNYLLAVAVFTPIVALVARFTARLSGADVRYLTAVASTFLGYFLLILIGLILGSLPGVPMAVKARFLLGVTGMLLGHAVFLRSRDKERVGFFTAVVVTVAQVATGFGIYYAVEFALAQ
jgi:hypothetical protein